MILAAGARHELANATRRVAAAIRILRSEALIVVVVAADNHVGIGIVERLPKRLHLIVISMRATGAEQRLVPIRQRAGSRVRRQVGAQPLNLARTCAAAPYVRIFAVKNDDVPGYPLILVVAILGISRGRPKVIEVRRRAPGMKFVITRRRPSTIPHGSPSSVVALKILFGAIGISEVAHCHYRARNLLQ